MYSLRNFSGNQISTIEGVKFPDSLTKLYESST